MGISGIFSYLKISLQTKWLVFDKSRKSNNLYVMAGEIIMKIYMDTKLSITIKKTCSTHHILFFPLQLCHC